MIDREQVRNGTVWDAKHPMCGRLIVQWVDQDQWLLLGVPERAAYGANVMVAYSHGPVLKTHEQLCGLLESFGAEKINAMLVLIEVKGETEPHKPSLTMLEEEES